MSFFTIVGMVVVCWIAAYCLFKFVQSVLNVGLLATLVFPFWLLSRLLRK